MTRLWRRLDLGRFGVAIAVAVALVVGYLLYPHPRREARQAGVTDIVFWAPSATADVLRPALEEFERRNPHYNVVIGSSTARDITGDPTRFLLGVAGGVPPDVIYFDRFAIVEWASRGAFTDLTPLVERDRDLPDGVREEEFFAPVWRETVYRDHIYAIGNSVDSRAMYFL